MHERILKLFQIHYNYSKKTYKEQLVKDLSLKVLYSQSLEALIEAWIEEFFVCEAPVFESRLIVVPHLGIKEFLVDSLSSRLNIASGAQILPLHPAVMEIVDRADPQ